MRRGRRGFSLLEVTVVLGIAGLIIAGVWMLAGQAAQNNRKATLNRDTLQIIQSIRGVFTSQSAALGTFRNNEAITAGVFPANWLVIRGNTAIVHHPFATDFTTASVSVFEAGNNVTVAIGNATIEALAIPADACIELVDNLMASQNFRDLGFVRVDVRSGGNVTNFSTNDLPFRVAQAAGACSTPRTNLVQITFDPF